MSREVVAIPRTDAMFAALDRVVAAAAKDENAAFEAAIGEFWLEFDNECDRAGLTDLWDPEVVLALLETALLTDESLSLDDRVGYAAAVAGIREIVAHLAAAYRAEQAVMN